MSDEPPSDRATASARGRRAAPLDRPTDPLLAPKLNPPASRGRQVPRDALLDTLQHAGPARLLLLCAPAGFGKTTALEQSRARDAERGLATAWLTLDAQDNDRSRCLAGLQAALETLQAATGARTAPGTVPASTRPVGEWSLALLDGFAALPAPFALTLDEFEALHDPGVLALIGELIERLPRHGRLVIGSRSRPPLPLARLRLRGELLDLDASHLRFSLQETTRLFAETSRTVPGELLRRLHEQSEGWVAALRLAALALDRPAGSAHASELLDRFAGSQLALADYLAEDVLAGLGPAEREFLLCTSVLKHLHPAICQALLPGVDAAALLDSLAAANLFLTPILGEPSGYRYHALFANFLRAQLDREQPGRSLALHRAAAGWFESEQRPVPAIDHALEGQDLPRALRLLEAHAMPLLMQGRLRLLARWLHELPAAALQAHPRLHAIGLWALCFVAGAPEALERLTQSDLQTSADPVVRGLVDALPPAALAMQDRAAEAYAIGSPLLARLAHGDAAFADTVLVNVLANAATVLGRNQEARRLLDAGRRAQGREPSPFSLMYADSVDGIIDLLEGRLRQASARFRLAVNPPAQPTSPLPTYAAGNAWAGLLYAATVYERNELDTAQPLLQVYLPLVCDTGLPDHMILGHVMLARIATQHGDRDQAQQVLAELEALGHTRGLERVVAGARLERARMALLQGEPMAMQAELDRLQDSPVWARIAGECHLANDLENLAFSQLRQALVFGDTAAATAALPRIEHQIALATATSSHRRVLLLRLLEAMALLRTGQPDKALSQLLLVLKVCAREGFVRLLLDEGPLAGELLQRLLARDEPALRHDPILADHATTVLAAFGPLPALADLPQPTQRLTAQEQRVLQDVAEGLSNDEVAERHGISRSTVRTHMRNISAKLGAQNRTQAVSLARRQGLLG